MSRGEGAAGDFRCMEGRTACMQGSPALAPSHEPCPRLLTAPLLLPSHPLRSLADDPALTCINRHRTPGSLSNPASMSTPSHSARLTPSWGTSTDLSLQRGGSGGAPLPDLAPWELQYSDLTILRALGSGSFGAVYLASRNETLCALKVLLTGEEDAMAPPRSSSGSRPAPLPPVIQALRKVS